MLLLLRVWLFLANCLFTKSEYLVFHVSVDSLVDLLEVVLRIVQLRRVLNRRVIFIDMFFIVGLVFLRF